VARPRKAAPGDVDLPPKGPDGRILLTGAQAAAVAGTSRRNINTWHDKGWLPAAGQRADGRRERVYDRADVLRADAIARGVLASAA
jgi:hypothetical protein